MRQLLKYNDKESMKSVSCKMVLYEAKCEFCNACRRFVESRDIKGVFTFFDIYSEEAEIIIQKNNLSTQDSYDSIVVTDEQGLYHTKYRACLYIAKHLKQPWPIISWLLWIIPNVFGDWCYDYISKHRKFIENKWYLRQNCKSNITNCVLKNHCASSVYFENLVQPWT